MASSGSNGPATATAEATALFERYRVAVDDALDAVLPTDDTDHAGLHEAMRYSLFAGGKRLRPILLMAAGEACGAGLTELLPGACAVELIHTYSLIHDDLPAFDDDDLRRGKPTSHRVFGEPEAILAGDALQTLAFSHLAQSALQAKDPRPLVEAAALLADAAGSKGMAGGQWEDVQAEGCRPELDALAALHAAKTGALLTACVQIGATVAGAAPSIIDAIANYGRAVGLAFQVVDDLLDVEGSVEQLGKEPGVDAARGKATYPALLGTAGARQEAARLHQQAIAYLEPLGPAAHNLTLIADYIIARSR